MRVGIQIVLGLFAGGFCLGLGAWTGGLGKESSPVASEMEGDEPVEAVHIQAPGLTEDFRRTEAIDELRELILRTWHEASPHERDSLMLLAVARWKEIGDEKAKHQWDSFLGEVAEGEPDFHSSWRWRGQRFLDGERGLKPLVEPGDHDKPLAERVLKITNRGSGQRGGFEELGAALAVENPGETSAIDAWLKDSEKRGGNYYSRKDREVPFASSFAIEWSKLDPQAAFDWIGSVSGIWSADVRDELLLSVGERDPALAKQLFSSLEPKDAFRAESALVELLAARGIAQAVEWLEQRPAIPEGSEGWSGRNGAIRKLAPGLVELPLEESLPIIDQFFSGFDIGGLAGRPSGIFVGRAGVPADGIASHRAGQEAQFAAELTTFPKSLGRDLLLRSVYERWATSDPHAAVDHLLEISSGDADQISRLAGQLANALGDTAPERGLELAAQMNPEERVAFLTSMSWTSVRENAQPAAQGIASLAADGSEFGAQAAEIFVARWARDDLLSTSTWLRELPEGAVRDAGVGSLVAELAPVEPSSAFLWAESISDAEVRMEAITAAAAHWKSIAPEEAAAAIAGSELSDAEKSAALDAALPEGSRIPSF